MKPALILCFLSACLPHVSLLADTPDTASAIVDHYLELTDPSSLNPDSMLVLETLITNSANSDTFRMTRWFAAPQMQRVEVRHGSTLTAALCTNGKNRYREYVPSLGYWTDIPQDRFFYRVSGYDCRGPLHAWRSSGVSLSYRGPASAHDGQHLEAVAVEAPGMFNRIYFFEESGLLSLIVESDEMADSANYKYSTKSHIQWKMVHEYQYAGRLLLPRQESFLRQGTLTILTTEARTEPRRNMIFNQD